MTPVAINAIGGGALLFTGGFIAGWIAKHYHAKWWGAYKKYTKPGFAVEHHDDWERMK